MFEAMVATTWLAAHTERLKVGSLVLCEAFRLPAVLARQVVSVDHASGGRYELGIGWGSVRDEFETFGVGSTDPRERVDRLRETLEVLRALWAGEVVDYRGRYHQLEGARQEPTSVGPHPDCHRRDRAQDTGAGAGLRRLVERAHRCPRQVRRARRQVGNARLSIQQMVAFVGRYDDRQAVAALAERRFGFAGPVIGSGAELLDHYGRLAERGVERVNLVLRFRSTRDAGRVRRGGHCRCDHDLGRVGPRAPSSGCRPRPRTRSYVGR